MSANNDDRHSVADIPSIVSDPEEVRKLEVSNGNNSFKSIDLSAVEQLIGAHFSAQLLSVANQAGIDIEQVSP